MRHRARGARRGTPVLCGAVRPASGGAAAHRMCLPAPRAVPRFHWALALYRHVCVGGVRSQVSMMTRLLCLGQTLAKIAISGGLKKQMIYRFFTLLFSGMHRAHRRSTHRPKAMPLVGNKKREHYRPYHKRQSVAPSGPFLPFGLSLCGQLILNTSTIGFVICVN